MKNRILSLAFLGTVTFLSGINVPLHYEEPMALCIGDIVFNTDIIDPDLSLYFKGNKLQLDINHDKQLKKIGQVATQKESVKIVPYTLQETKATQKFHLLICSRPEFASDSNTITYLYVPEKVSYKFYTLSAARKINHKNKNKNEPDGCLWNVTQEFLLDDRIVPDNTIIFLFNADYVEGLDVKSWPLNSNIRLLPSIMINKNTQAQDIIRAIIEARMTAIDFDTIHHRHPKNSTRIESKTVLAIKP